MAIEVLTEEDKAKVKEALASVKDIRAELRKAKRAGIDVEDLEKELEDAVAKLRAIERVYIRGG